jgi:hypothetical protein
MRQTAVVAGWAGVGVLVAGGRAGGAADVVAGVGVGVVALVVAGARSMRRGGKGRGEAEPAAASRPSKRRVRGLGAIIVVTRWSVAF